MELFEETNVSFIQSIFSDEHTGKESSKNKQKKMYKYSQEKTLYNLHKCIS